MVFGERMYLGASAETLGQQPAWLSWPQPVEVARAPRRRAAGLGWTLAQEEGAGGEDNLGLWLLLWQKWKGAVRCVEERRGLPSTGWLCLPR